MRVLVFVVVAMLGTTAMAREALWTGGSEWVYTVTGKPATKCYYAIAGLGEWSILLVKKEGSLYYPSCPPSIEIE